MTFADDTTDDVLPGSLWVVLPDPVAFDGSQLGAGIDGYSVPATPAGSRLHNGPIVRKFELLPGTFVLVAGTVPGLVLPSSTFVKLVSPRVCYVNARHFVVGRVKRVA